MDNLKIINKLQKIVSNRPHEYQAVEDLFEMLRISLGGPSGLFKAE